MKITTYKPKTRIKLSKEETIPFFLRAGNACITKGGALSLVVMGLFMSLESFFSIKNKISAKNLLKRKYVELKVKD